MIGSSFIHPLRTDSDVLLFKAESYSMVYVYHSFLIHSSADGHLGCFHVLAIVNSAAMNSGLCVSFQIMVFSGVGCPGVRLLDHMAALFLDF